MTAAKLIIIGGMGIRDFPLRERWLLREHANETQSQIGPWLERYVRYWSVLPPATMVPDLERMGSYTSGVTMHVYKDLPPLGKEQWGMVGQAPRPGQNKNKLLTVGQTYENPNVRPENGRIETTFCYVPYVPTEDFLGSNIDLWSTGVLRWITCFKYPENVSREEGDNWYLNTHAKEVMQQDGLLRFFSYRTIDPSGNGKWHRVSEQWYADYDSWYHAVIRNPPDYTVPAWASYPTYPFFAPYQDFLGSFILERPTHDLLQENLSYVIGP